MEKLYRQAKAWVVIIVLVSIGFMIVYYIQQFGLKLTSKYPEVDCIQLQESYGKEFYYYAYSEYLDYQNPEYEYYMTGSLQCFCYSQNKTGLGFIDTTEYLNPISNTSEQICKQVGVDYNVNYALTSSVSYLIVGINYFLRLAIIALVIWIGNHTESEQTSMITDSVFIVQFLNTAFLLLAANANMKEQGPVLGFFFQGFIPDFTSQWYNDIGYSMMYTMEFNIYWPLIEFFMYWGMRLAFRALDRGIFSCDTYKTKCTTLQQYVELYSGPVYFIHYKYSSILNITFVTFMYGLGIPAMWPIAVVQYFVLYIVEKLMIYYSYRQPPMYDNKLNDRVLGILSYAPLFLLTFGYWMVSNKQLLSNDYIYYVVQSSDIMETGHLWTSVFKKEGYLNPGMPLLICFWAMVVLFIFRGWLHSFMTNHFSFYRVGEFEIDEGLPNYFNTLDDHDRKWSIKEEENCRNVLHFKILTDETLEKTQGGVATGMTMQGVHTYDILANPLYLDDFSYFSADRDDRADCIIDDDSDEDNDAAQSDLVRMVLNLAFLPRNYAENFTFDKYAYAQISKGATKK
mmetsp:Transcript_21710/g.16011  ORF Transcript_21710/g.16011 Transcript_21710/m.16011 type:complete len:569 (+) Transcript_21710:1-1707(+)